MTRGIRQAVEILEYPQLRLETLRVCTLTRELWHNTVLDGHFWRLYHNSAPGAGLWLNGNRVELMPENLYLLPPHCGLRTWCRDNPVQLYLHFEFTRLSGRAECPCCTIPMSSDLAAKVAELRRRCCEDPLSARLPLLAIAIASNVMTMVPDSALYELNPDSRITVACDMIRRTLSQPLNLEDLARHAGMARNSFLRKFREVTGSTPYQYILNLRYSLAGRLLKESSLSIDSICEQIGINDRFHFSRKFKELYGLPPGEYRKNRSFQSDDF